MNNIVSICQEFNVSKSIIIGIKYGNEINHLEFSRLPNQGQRDVMNPRVNFELSIMSQESGLENSFPLRRLMMLSV